jgi:hypothetical protein
LTEALVAFAKPLLVVLPAVEWIFIWDDASDCEYNPDDEGGFGLRWNEQESTLRRGLSLGCLVAAHIKETRRGKGLEKAFCKESTKMGQIY